MRPSTFFRMRYLLCLLLWLFSLALPTLLWAQQDNIPLNATFHAVDIYEYLKEMRVKKITSFFHDDNLPLSRLEVIQLLREIAAKENELSETERRLLRRFQITFDESFQNTETFSNLIQYDRPFSERAAEIFSDKEKNFFYYKRDSTRIFVELLLGGHNVLRLEPRPNVSAFVYDAAFRFRVTLFGQLGTMLSFTQGMNPGSRDLVLAARPDLRTNFKLIEGNIQPEEFPNYTLSEGYVRFYTEPTADLNISFQIGREPIRYGFGYGNRLMVSGNGPVLDFLKINANYGIFHYAMVHASTVGNFSFNRDERYTKFFALHKLKVSVPNWFSATFGDVMVYSGRGLEVAYLNPIIFYKFLEQDVLQDRDNSLIFVDMQTHFFKNFELQGTFVMDEALSLQFFSPNELVTDKYAFQIGAFWYEAFWIQNLSFVAEYTYIRPFFYSHINPRNAFTANGLIVGNPIGPNADELYLRLSYNAMENLRLNLEFRSIRRGENVFDAEGRLVKNVGGDVDLTNTPDIPLRRAAPFLDGTRFNDLIFTASLRYEPLKNYVIELRYHYQVEQNVSQNLWRPFSFGFVRFTAEY
ncbi:MAG: hypothetical protein RMI34_11350 [Chloroherpetonaceae bacterium]|nr:hypothetical protein [Chloroherpetonaceae bacterium]MCS7210195.1 hypothetical protein [Chloroherpetonaceae bacterium]MDW8020657.1 hypothetical protein [Chloroherpetonaceae bacterium]